MISSDPARHLRPPKEPKKLAEAIDPAALPVLLGCSDPLIAIAVRLAADTGARRSNILGLRFCDIDGTAVRFVHKVIEEGTRAVVKVGNKTGERVHTVTISPDTAEAVQAYREQRSAAAEGEGAQLSASGFVVSESLDHSDPIRPGVFYGRWQRAVDEVGLGGRICSSRGCDT